MKIRIFVALTLALALLFCAIAYFVRPGGSEILTVIDHDPGGKPSAYFIPENRSDRRIDCPVKFAPDMAVVWQHEPELCFSTRDGRRPRAGDPGPPDHDPGFSSI